MNVRKELAAYQLIAFNLINGREKDLDRVLSYGERKDLLKDNTNWDDERCAYVIQTLKQRGFIL